MPEMIELLKAFQEEFQKSASRIVSFQSFEGYKVEIIVRTPSEIILRARNIREDDEPDRYFRLKLTEMTDNA